MRLNITVPDDVAMAAKQAGLNISRVAATALVGELERRRKIAGLDEYLIGLDGSLGPVTAADRAAADAWADQLLGTAQMGPPTSRRSA